MISHFRLSNHPWIEKTRHLKIDRICKDDIEDAKHLLIKYPLFYKQRKHLEIVCIENVCVENCKNYLMSKSSYYSWQMKMKRLSKNKESPYVELVIFCGRRGTVARESDRQYKTWVKWVRVPMVPVRRIWIYVRYLIINL